MAITIDYGNTNVIFIPQADLTLVSGTLYELDIDTFRLTLKGIEDGDAGMSFPRTHNHNTEITIAGTTFARSVEILSPYSVEFEDGQYSVRLFGANNNIFDIQNNILAQNNVQVIPSNSAGLQTFASAATLANIRSEMVSALSVDVYSEPGQGAPSSTASIVSKLGYLYKALRNKSTQTATQYELYSDDGVTVDHKAAFSDNGSTAETGKLDSGP